jgi:hypothetical protein
MTSCILERETQQSASSVLSFYSEVSPSNDKALPLRERVRDGIRSGKLPNRKPSSTWGGSGNGARCAVCDGNLRRDQVELEFEVKHQDGTNNTTYRMHVSCYTTWEAELHDGLAPVVGSEAVGSRRESDVIHESETSTGRSR